MLVGTNCGMEKILEISRDRGLREKLDLSETEGDEQTRFKISVSVSASPAQGGVRQCDSARDRDAGHILGCVQLTYGAALYNTRKTHLHKISGM